MAKTRSCLEALVPAQCQVFEAWKTWQALFQPVETLIHNVHPWKTSFSLPAISKSKSTTLKEVAGFVLQWNNITQTYNSWKNNQPHFRTYRKALAETKPRSSSWRFQSWVQVDQDLLWQQHLKCFPTKIGTCGVMKLEMVKIHCHSFTSPDLRSVAHVSWPKATREMPKSQTLISPLRLNLAEQQVDSRQMAP